MARILRLRMSGVPQHVVRRGNNRHAIFFSEDDYAFYLRCLEKSAGKHGCAINAYVLMTNHVHLLATPYNPDALSLMMRDLDRHYTQYINRAYRRTGTLWEGRFANNLVDTETYLFHCYRYIECNPVRAGLVAHPRDYCWSSYRCNAEGAPDSVVTPHPEHDRLGSSAEARLQAYRDLFQNNLDPEYLAAIRSAIHHGWPLGSESFRDQIEKSCKTACIP